MSNIYGIIYKVCVCVCVCVYIYMCVCVCVCVCVYIYIYTHIHITYKVYVTYGIPEGEGREMGIKNLFDEVIDEHLPNLKKEIDIEKALSSLNKMKASRSTPKHIINKRAKVKDVGFSRQQGKSKFVPRQPPSDY